MANIAYSRTFVIAANIPGVKYAWNADNATYTNTTGDTAGIKGYNRYYPSGKGNLVKISSSGTLAIVGALYAGETYYYNGFSWTISAGITNLKVVTIPDGYRFLGWYTYDGIGTYAKDDSYLVKNVGTGTLSKTQLESCGGYSQVQSIYGRDGIAYFHFVVAKFERITYTVTFNANGGSVSPTSATTDTNGDVTLPTPKRTGHAFSGWYTSASGGTKIGDAGGKYKPSSNITVYAQWTANVYSISYTLNGGTNPSGAPTNYTYGVGATLPIPTRTGYYKFEGWYASSTFSGSAVTSISKTDTGNKTYYAKWTEVVHYAVTYNANGGSVSPAAAQSGPEVPVTLPLPNRSEFIFIGWYDSAEGGTLVGLNGDEYRATEAITLYAHWRAERDYIVFDANGGESVSTSYVQVYVGSQIGTLPTASWGDAEYSFVGWFTEQEGGTQITETTIVTDEMPRRLFAHWRDNKVTVTFDANGGLAPVRYLLVAGVSYGELPTAYKYGYSFEGWYSSSSLTDRVVSTSIVPAFDHTLYAKFEQSSGETYSIVFRDDVSGQTATVEAPVGQNFILPDVSSGLGFVVPSGYATDPIRSWICMNTGAVYANRALVKDLVPSGETVVLTWVLVKNSVTITLDPNGGTLETTIYQKLAGDQYGTLPEPSLDGKNFDGWYTEKTGGTRVSPTDTVTASVTLYARWSVGVVPWFEFIVS